MHEERIFCALDLGSSKVSAVVAQVLSAEDIEVLGVGISPSQGIRAGAVTNIEEASSSIRSAIGEAELSSGVEVDRVLLNISGKHVRGENSSGVVAITNKHRVIGEKDVERVISAAKAI